MPASPETPSQPGRLRVGRILGPVLALVLYALLPSTVPESARRTAGVGVLMAVYWMTEAIPVPATALLPLVLFPLLGVLEIDQAAAPFAKPVIFLFLGGFMLARAVERCGLHRRIALLILRAVGGTPGRLLAGFMAATALLSMWLSNTATALMMTPIALSLGALIPRDDTDAESSSGAERFQLCLLLSIAYSCSIGGQGTIVGTPTNALLIGFLSDRGIEIGFGRWMLVAVPIVVVFFAIVWLIVYRFFLGPAGRAVGIDHSVIDEQYRGLGAMTRGERTVLAVFLGTAALWLFSEPLANWRWLVDACPWVAHLNDATIAMTAAVLLFLLPADTKTGERTLDWKSVGAEPWGILILFGGGLSLSTAMVDSSLNQVLADAMVSLQSLPPLLLTMAVTALIIFLTEFATNAATLAAMLPVLYGLGENANGGQLQLMIPGALAASCAFMLPAATPPNAVVYGTGRVPMPVMVRCGFWLNLIGILLIPVAMYVYGDALPDGATP